MRSDTRIFGIFYDFCQRKYLFITLLTCNMNVGKYCEQLGKTVCILLLLFTGMYLQITNNTLLSPTTSTHSVRKYNSFDLLSIRRKCKQFQMFRTLSGHVVSRIRSLKIQKKRKQGRCRGIARVNKQSLPKTLNVNNVTVALTHFNRNYIIFGLINAHSLMSKDQYLEILMDTTPIDICVITKTWLSSSDKCSIWKKEPFWMQVNGH